MPSSVVAWYTWTVVGFVFVNKVMDPPLSVWNKCIVKENQMFEAKKLIHKNSTKEQNDPNKE